MIKKTDRDIAAAHGKWLMDTIEVVAGAIFDAMKPIMVDVMEHGIKHGRELEGKCFEEEKETSLE